jgi:hypothetical protein
MTGRAHPLEIGRLVGLADQAMHTIPAPTQELGHEQRDLTVTSDDDDVHGRRDYTE